MSDYKDENILSEVFKAQHKEYIETENVLEINGEIGELERRGVNDIFSIILSKNFIEMTEELREVPI